MGERAAGEGSARVVVLSPHLDDAVISLGALIARAAAVGCVEVWTAFTRGPDPDTLPRRWRPFGDYATRCSEDDRALARLGAGHRRLDLPEHIWRGTATPGLTEAFRGPASVDGFACLPELTATVAGLLADPGVEIYAPLGVGRHADHLEVAVAALHAGTAAGALHRIGFYEDFYALGGSFHRRHPVTRLRPAGRLAAPPGWAAPGLGAMLDLMAATMPGHELAHYVPDVAGLDWSCEPQPLGELEPVKLAAVAEYASQVSRLGGRRQLTAALRRAHRVRGGEPVWRTGAAGVRTPGSLRRG